MTNYEYILYMSFVIGFALTPGPNMILYLTHTFEYGRKAGWLTVAGITSAFVFHVIATVLGLTALLIAAPGALDILRYLGIAYLFYVAWSNLQTVKWKEGNGENKERPSKHFYMKGLIGNLLNPGTVLLYFSLIPQFIHPERKHILFQNLKLCGLQMLGSTLTNLTIVFLAGFATDRILKNETNQRYIRIIMSVFIVLFAVKMLFWKPA